VDAPFATVESEKLGKAVRARDAVGRYIEFCKASVPRASTCGVKVVLDCARRHVPDRAAAVPRAGRGVIAIGAARTA
jgi:phosphoglucosamine mutase